jgi:hypothetical protein
VVHPRIGDLSPVQANTTRVGRARNPQTKRGGRTGPPGWPRHADCGNGEGGQPGWSRRPGPDCGGRLTALNHRSVRPRRLWPGLYEARHGTVRWAGSTDTSMVLVMGLAVALAVCGHRWVVAGARRMGSLPGASATCAVGAVLQRPMAEAVAHDLEGAREMPRPRLTFACELSSERLDDLFADRPVIAAWPRPAPPTRSPASARRSSWPWPRPPPRSPR